MRRYIDAYKIPYHDLSDGRGKCEVAFLEDIIKVPTADVVEIGKPYFYEEGYVLKDFHNDGVHRYFVIERTEEYIKKKEKEDEQIQ